MEPIRDVAALRPIIQSLIGKGLVVSLTPEGRGQVVTHALYKPREMEKLRAEYGQAAAPAPVASAPVASAPAAERVAEPIDESAVSAPQAPRTAPAPPAEPSVPNVGSGDSAVAEALRREISELRTQVSQMRSDIEELTARQSRTDDDLRDLRDALGA